MSRATAMSEAQLQDAVLELAAVLGWRRYHPLPSVDRRGRWRTHMAGEVGFPDLVLARDGRLIFAELKRERQSPTGDQIGWLTALLEVGEHAGGAVDVVVWRPADWLEGRIERCLRRKGPAAGGVS